MDGHTESGSWPVTLEMTADQAEMTVRALRTALMYSGSGLDSSGNPIKDMQAIAYEVFIKEIIDMYEEALKQQRPT